MMLVVSVALAWTPTCVSEPLDTGVPLFELAAGETHVVAGSGFGAVWIMPDPSAGCSASLFTVPDPGRIAEGGRVTADTGGRDPEVSRLHVLPIVPRDHDGDGGCATATRAWAWWLPLALLRMGQTRRSPRRKPIPVIQPALGRLYPTKFHTRRGAGAAGPLEPAA